MYYLEKCSEVKSVKNVNLLYQLRLIWLDISIGNTTWRERSECYIDESNLISNDPRQTFL